MNWLAKPTKKPVSLRYTKFLYYPTLELASDENQARLKWLTDDVLSKGRVNLWVHQVNSPTSKVVREAKNIPTVYDPRTDSMVIDYVKMDSDKLMDPSRRSLYDFLSLNMAQGLSYSVFSKFHPKALDDLLQSYTKRELDAKFKIYVFVVVALWHFNPHGEKDGSMHIIQTSDNITILTEKNGSSREDVLIGPNHSFSDAITYDEFINRPFDKRTSIQRSMFSRFKNVVLSEKETFGHNRNIFYLDEGANFIYRLPPKTLY